MVTALGTRAVLRIIEPGTGGACAYCGEPLKFRARLKLRQVLANVYVDGAWDRLEQFHWPACYKAAGEPYGDPGPCERPTLGAKAGRR